MKRTRQEIATTISRLRRLIETSPETGWEEANERTAREIERLEWQLAECGTCGATGTIAYGVCIHCTVRDSRTRRDTF